MKISYGAATYLALCALAAVLGLLQGQPIYWLLLLALGLAVSVLLAARSVDNREWLTRLGTQAPFTLAVVLFGYPFAEAINHPEDQRIVNSLVVLALSLGVLAVPRYYLNRASRHAVAAAGEETASRIDELQQRLAVLEAAAVRPAMSPAPGRRRDAIALLAVLLVLTRLSGRGPR